MYITHSCQHNISAERVWEKEKETSSSFVIDKREMDVGHALPKTNTYVSIWRSCKTKKLKPFWPSAYDGNDWRWTNITYNSLQEGKLAWKGPYYPSHILQQNQDSSRSKLHRPKQVDKQTIIDGKNQPSKCPLKP